MHMMTAIDPDFYSPPLKETWKGRDDGDDPMVKRWHQHIQLVNILEDDLPESSVKAHALIGFACDEGVMRNGGRAGAKDGPLCFRQACGNLPVHFEASSTLLDFGDVICDSEFMEDAQNTLALIVEFALRKGYQPVVIGGGHEVSYGHYKGLRKSVPWHENIGIINFDAHFDLCEPIDSSTHSGTAFFQISTDCEFAGKAFQYLPIGIQQNSNTRQLYHNASMLGVDHIPSTNFCVSHKREILQRLDDFIAGCDHIYLTIDMDVFSSSVSPGVSAPAFCGLFPDALFFDCLEKISSCGKLISMDVAEYNPVYDSDHRTAKLAAAIVFSVLSTQAYQNSTLETAIPQHKSLT